MLKSVMKNNKESKKKRCPNGTQRNKVTNECVDKKNKTRKQKRKLLVIEDDEPPKQNITDLVTELAVVEQSQSSNKILDDLKSDETLMLLDDAPNKNDGCEYNLYEKYSNLDCNNNYTKECNEFKLKKEQVERTCLSDILETNDTLYPNLNDRNFNIKIAQKKEFNGMKYDGTIHKDIKGHANKLANMPFDLQPHQMFVKNFLSFNTPYNLSLIHI